jgi:SAM-dependent methyltransferase
VSGPGPPSGGKTGYGVIERHLRRNELVRRIARPILRVLRSSRTGRGAASPGHSRPPVDFRIDPRPAALSGAWPEPPPLDRPASPLVDPGPPTRPPVYDLALFERLNAEYADRPLVRQAPLYDPVSMSERSRSRLEAIHDRIGLAGTTVLEVGSGAGYEVWYLGHHLGCDAWGIDITARKAWPALREERVHLIEGDFAARDMLPSRTFDRVISFTAWEHISRPIEAIAQLERVMKPGALAWIRANLYRGPTSSHRSREIAFPFPHLLFPDAVIADGLGRAGRNPRGAAWVNRLTWEQYEASFRGAGFEIKALSFDLYPLDETFFHRFEDILGRYPRVDLERGFFSVILEKPPTPHA